MGIFESFRVALDGLRANKMRAALTMLGVVIGVMAVILLVSLGQGVKGYVTEQIQGLGSNLLFVFPGKISPGESRGQPHTVTRKLVPADAELIKKRAVFVKDAVANIEGAAKIKFGARGRRTSVLGTSADYPAVFQRPAVSGKFFSQSQVESSRRVTVLGKTVVDDIFGGKDPVGKRVSLGGQRYLVIGVLKEKGRFLGQDFDDVAYIPVTTAISLVGTDRVTDIIASAQDATKIKEAQDEIKMILGKKYTEEDFTVFTQGETLSILQTVLSIMTLMLAGIASISLLVGGIGIMNIMLVSVTERTREIGIRKAVGARTYDILFQFIIEAVALSLVGGGIGILLGALGAAVANRFIPAQVTTWSVLLAFGFSAAVGIFFGVYPAFKAARLDPIEALRYE